MHCVRLTGIVDARRKGLKLERDGVERNNFAVPTMTGTHSSNASNVRC